MDSIHKLIYDNAPLEAITTVMTDSTVNVIENNLTPLQFAIMYKRLDVVKNLIEKGADINQTTSDEVTALLHALYENLSLEIVKYILTQNPDVNRSDREGLMPLHLAINADAVEIVNLLLCQGADPNAVHCIRTDTEHDFFFTPLYIAIEKKNVEIIQNLIEHGADIHVIKKDGTSLLNSLIQEFPIDLLQTVFVCLLRYHSDFWLKEPRSQIEFEHFFQRTNSAVVLNFILKQEEISNVLKGRILALHFPDSYAWIQAWPHNFSMKSMTHFPTEAKDKICEASLALTTASIEINSTKAINYLIAYNDFQQEETISSQCCYGLKR